MNRKNGNNIQAPNQAHIRTEVPFTEVQINDQFWSKRLDAHKNTTLRACIDQCEQTGRIANFAKAAGQMEGSFQGTFFDDSDVYKVLEGMAFSLMSHPDPDLEQKADEIIDQIAAAQEEDGYLMTYFTLEKPDEKWTDMDKHEMYCGGHLIEAAIAYKQATGKRKLFDVACKVADHFDHTFGPGKRHWVPGHEEIELALVKLYRETGEERYWKLAQWLLEERGHGHGYGTIWDRTDWGPAYCQDHQPVRELSEVSGHAVRAMYLYSAMADVASMTGDEGYIHALDRLWESVVLRNMYVTGGIGSSKHNEGFTADYDLPNDTAYCETCASIGMVFWNHRMNLLHGDSKYADIVERELYNGVLAGVSLRGDTFFYVNPLESDGTHHRVEWFGTSCCPTNIARFIPSVGNYVYMTAAEDIWVNQYIAGTSTMSMGKGPVQLSQKTNYPWDGTVTITVEPEVESTFNLNLRIPGWCNSFRVSVNGTLMDPIQMEKGYLQLNHTWQAGDTITLVFDMPVKRVYSHPQVKNNEGKVALQRGPLVYCLEEVDNELDLHQYAVSLETKFLTIHKPDLLDGVTVITGIDLDPKEAFTAVPYYSWDNRKPGQMLVWLKQSHQTAYTFRSY